MDRLQVIGQFYWKTELLNWVILVRDWLLVVEDELTLTVMFVAVMVLHTLIQSSSRDKATQPPSSFPRTLHLSLPQLQVSLYHYQCIHMSVY